MKLTLDNYPEGLWCNLGMARLWAWSWQAKTKGGFLLRIALFIICAVIWFAVFFAVSVPHALVLWWVSPRERA